MYSMWSGRSSITLLSPLSQTQWPIPVSPVAISIVSEPVEVSVLAVS